MGFQTQGWSRFRGLAWTEISRLQDETLHRFINEELYPFSPYYRRLFDQNKIDPRRIRSVKDLRHVPFTTKADLAPSREEPGRPLEFVLAPTRELISQRWPMRRRLGLLARLVLRGQERLADDLDYEYRPIFVTRTTGRSAAPVSFFYTAHDIDNLRLAGGRHLALIGVGRSDRGVSLMPFAPHLAFWQVVFAGLGNGVMCLCTGGGKTLGTKGNIGAITQFRPTFLLGIPGYTYHLLRTARQEGADFSSIRIVGLGAEKVTPLLKERIVGLLEEMGARDPVVVGTFGFTEAKMAWSECVASGRAAASTGYHTSPDLEVFEVVDPRSGEPVGEGEPGELTYTGIGGRGSVVLRYRLGDYLPGGVLYEPCPACQTRVPRITPEITRVSNVKDFQLSKIKGTLVNLNALAQLLSDCPDVEEWQVEIRKRLDDPLEMDELYVYVAPRAGSDGAGLGEMLKRKITEDIEVAPNEVRLRALPEVLERLGMETELKERRIVDARPAG